MQLDQHESDNNNKNIAWDFTIPINLVTEHFRAYVFRETRRCSGVEFLQVPRRPQGQRDQCFSHQVKIQDSVDQFAMFSITLIFFL